MTKTYQLPKQFLDDVSDFSLTYVVDEGDGIYNKDGGHLLLRGEFVAQNNHIKLSLDCTDSEDPILTSDDLRNMAEKLIEWADISDQTNK